MMSMTMKSLGLLVVVLMTFSPRGIQSSPGMEMPSVLHSPVDENTVVRFFYQPTPGDYFRFPLIFRAAKEEDPRVNTAPMKEEGRTAYISVSEMRELVQRLARMRLAWKESKAIEGLGPFKNLLDDNIGEDTMEVFVRGLNGTARGTLAPDMICTTLAPLDSVFKTPRALWEFQLFRKGYDCKVTGFDRKANPDHI